MCRLIFFIVYLLCDLAQGHSHLDSLEFFSEDREFLQEAFKRFLQGDKDRGVLIFGNLNYEQTVDESSRVSHVLVHDRLHDFGIGRKAESNSEHLLILDYGCESSILDRLISNPDLEQYIGGFDGVYLGTLPYYLSPLKIVKVMESLHFLLKIGGKIFVQENRLFHGPVRPSLHAKILTQMYDENKHFSGYLPRNILYFCDYYFWKSTDLISFIQQFGFTFDGNEGSKNLIFTRSDSEGSWDVLRESARHVESVRPAEINQVLDQFRPSRL